jgi:glycine cleavage system H protein
VTEVNDALSGDASLVNSSPAGDGWLWKMRLADEGQLAGLLDEAAYLKSIA